MHRLSLGISDGSISLKHVSTATIADRLVSELLSRCSDAKSVADVVIELLAEAFPPDDLPLRFGEAQFQMVMNFSTGQTLSFPLWLRDRDFVGSEIFLNGAALEGARLIVQSEREARSICQLNGHVVEPIQPSRTLARPDSTCRVACKKCGALVVIQMDPESSDVDSCLARATANEALVTGVNDTNFVTLLAAVDRWRRRLEKRSEEIFYAREQLEFAAEALGTQIAKMAR